jgi:hypothetical protein
MVSRRIPTEDGRDAWRCATVIIVTVLVFGFVTTMVLLGQNILAATAAAGASGMAAANLAKRLTDEGDCSAGPAGSEPEDDGD